MAWAERNPDEQSRLYVEVLSGADDSIYSLLAIPSGSKNQGWQSTTLSLSAFMNRTIKLRFRADDDWWRQGHVLLDSLSFAEGTSAALLGSAMSPDNNYLQLSQPNAWALSSPITVISPSTTLQFNYIAWAMRNGSEVSRLYVEVLTPDIPNSNSTLVRELQGSWLNGWQDAQIDMSAFLGKRIQLRFRVDDDWWRQGRARIDNVMLAPADHSFSAMGIKPGTSWQINQLNWSMTATVSANDGLVLNNVRLRNRYLASQMSVPYFNLTLVKPDGNTFTGRFQLQPESSGFGRSKLLSYTRTIIETDSELQVKKLVILAIYKVDQLYPGSQSSVIITQRYEFLDSVSTCEPSQEVPYVPHGEPNVCNPFRPIVSYSFNSANDDLVNLTVPQRLDYDVDQKAANVASLMRDCDNPRGIVCGIDTGVFVIDEAQNPVLTERIDEVIDKGKSKQTWDNYHQTYQPFVTMPQNMPARLGCPECMHTHWRWSAEAASPRWNGGDPIILRGEPENYQSLSVALTRYHIGESDPIDVNKLIQDHEPIAVKPKIIPNPPNPDGSPAGATIVYADAAYDLVYWQIATGYRNNESFFIHHAFFAPLIGNDLELRRVPSPQGNDIDAGSPQKPAVISLNTPFIERF